MSDDNSPSLLNQDRGPLDDIRHIVAVASGKGGVGKSTVSANLAVALQQDGFRVGLLDADIYGPSQPGLLGSRGETPRIERNLILPVKRHGIDFVSMGLMLGESAPVVWRAPMAMQVIHQFLGNVAWGELDYLLVDLPPGTGDVQLTLAQQAHLTGAVIVTTPQEVALGVARRGLLMFGQVNVPIVGVLENMSGFVCGHCGKTTEVFSAGGGQRLAQTHHVPWLGALPLDPEIMQSGEDGRPVLTHSRKSPAAVALRAAASRLREEVENLAAREAAGPEDVRLNEEGDIVVTWGDGHVGLHRPYNLRLNCPCAECIDERTGERVLDQARVPLDVTVKRAITVGRYALAFDFSDGHRTGIYSYDRLREICECTSCSAGRKKTTASFTV